MKLDLDDLQPQEAQLELSRFPGKPFTLKPLSLATQIWIRKRFGKEEIDRIFESGSMPELSEIVYYLIKDKALIPTLEDFMESIITQKDRVNLFSSIFTVVGISQPVLDKAEKESVSKNDPGLSPAPTGA